MRDDTFERALLSELREINTGITRIAEELHEQNQRYPVYFVKSSGEMERIKDFLRKAYSDNDDNYLYK